MRVWVVVDTKLSLYLMKSGIDSFETVLRGQYLTGDDAFQELSLVRQLAYECKAFVQQNKMKSPKWVDFIDGYFEVGGNLQNSSNSFVLLLKIEERIFAATFGHGYNVIDRTQIEQGFGLRVTLNEISSDHIETLDTRNIDLVTKQRRTHLNIGSPVSAFGLNENIDWVRFVSGKPVSKEYARKLSGSDSLSITCNTAIEHLGSLCETLLEKFQSQTYKEHFGFIDYLKPLQRHHDLVEVLNNKLKDLLETRVLDRITAAHPEIPESSIVNYKIFSGRKKLEIEEISLEQIYVFMDTYPDLDDYLSKTFIVGIDSEGDQKTPKFRLKDYLVCEISDGSATYILSLGEWFLVDDNYVQTVKQRVGEIQDITEEITPIPIRDGETEGNYNERLGAAKQWLVLDKRLFNFGGGDKFEISDLLTPTGQFLCVKKMSSSATLSHLFAQGSVSAKLLRSEPNVAKFVREQHEQRWPQLDYVSTYNPMFVYVIPTKKSGPLSECLFFFSLINLLDHVQTIRAFGYQVALCKVSYETV